jgi:hypothetical protein
MATLTEYITNNTEHLSIQVINVSIYVEPETQLEVESNADDDTDEKEISM